MHGNDGAEQSEMQGQRNESRATAAGLWMRWIARPRMGGTESITRHGSAFDSCPQSTVEADDGERGDIPSLSEEHGGSKTEENAAKALEGAKGRSNCWTDLHLMWMLLDPPFQQEEDPSIGASEAIAEMHCDLVQTDEFQARGEGIEQCRFLGRFPPMIGQQSVCLFSSGGSGQGSYQGGLG